MYIIVATLNKKVLYVYRRHSLNRLFKLLNRMSSFKKRRSYYTKFDFCFQINNETHYGFEVPDIKYSREYCLEEIKRFKRELQVQEFVLEIIKQLKERGKSTCGTKESFVVSENILPLYFQQKHLYGEVKREQKLGEFISTLFYLIRFGKFEITNICYDNLYCQITGYSGRTDSFVDYRLYY